MRLAVTDFKLVITGVPHLREEDDAGSGFGRTVAEIESFFNSFLGKRPPGTRGQLEKGDSDVGH